jgi:PAS domain-containing protein
MAAFLDKIVNAMHAQRNWLRAMICSIGDAVIATDALGIVTFVNSEAMRLTGWTRGTALAGCGNTGRLY